MAWRERLASWVAGRDLAAVPSASMQEAALADLPLQPAAPAHQEALNLLPGGVMIDSDEGSFRRLTGDGTRSYRRDLAPLQQDRMLQIAWYLWESNPFAHRLVTLMTDLILGEGISVEAKDERLNQVIADTWLHPLNQLPTRIREFHISLSLSGELILPAAVNPVTGVVVLGFIDPLQVHTVEPLPMNVLVPDVVVLKSETGGPGQRLKIIRPNPETGRLEGEVFYHGINKLPNSTRGRSDLLPLADWLDLYDQYMFAEVERLHLLSAFVWDYTVENADEDVIREKVRNFPTPKPGTIFGHNQAETLEARTPDLQASDRSEVARMLRTHIAGSMGFPLSYLGETDSNRATIEGQNDIVLKTPAARQIEFASFLRTVVQYGIEQATTLNPALFRAAAPEFDVRMPEIAAKDVARAGGVLAQVATAMDTALANNTVSRRVATVATCAVLSHLGVPTDAAEVMQEADQERQEQQDQQDLLQQAAARLKAEQRVTMRRNPPIPAEPAEA